MMGLYEKLYQIMCETEGLDKSITVGSGSNAYKAISEKAVLNEIKPLLKKHRVILFPVGAEIEEHTMEYESGRGKSNRFISQVVATYKIVDVDTGESELLMTVGNGADSQDKGSGKAWTYAYKALLQKTFMLFSGEDTDNTHSDDLEKETTRTMPQPYHSEVADLILAMNQPDLENAILKGYKINSIFELSEDKASQVIKTLTKRLSEKLEA